MRQTSTVALTLSPEGRARPRAGGGSSCQLEPPAGDIGFGRPGEPTRMADPNQPAVHAVGVPHARMWPGLAVLRRARACAADVNLGAWEFAVELRELRSAGVTHTDLRWLLCHGYVAHAVEQPAGQGGGRQFRPAPGLALSRRSCFVLTDAGAALAPAVEAVAQAASLSHVPARSERTPFWDDSRRELVWLG